jgi:predicted GNAT superfamily acetyltransferase
MLSPLKIKIEKRLSSTDVSKAVLRISVESVDPDVCLVREEVPEDKLQEVMQEILFGLLEKGYALEDFEVDPSEFKFNKPMARLH